MTNLDYLYSIGSSGSRFDKDFFVDKKLGFSVIERGTILPHIKTFNGRRNSGRWGFGGIVDSAGKFIKSSFVHYGAGGAYTPSKPVQRSPQTVIYLGMFHSTWGHVITDNIRRLWFLKSDLFRSQFKNCPLVCTICTKKEDFSIKEYSNFKRLLDILEVDVDKIQTITVPTIFEKIILPDESFYCEENNLRKFTNEYREAIHQIKDFAMKNRTPTASKKFYYFYGRKNIGEERIAEYFKSKGYVIIRPEKLTLDEQLNILINAESFASTIGSCAMNSLFLRDGTETILIPRAAKKFGGYQEVINQLNSLKAIYVDASLSVFQRVYCFILSKHLKKFFGDKFDGYSDADFKIFLQYVKTSMSKNIAVNIKATTYYNEILPDFFEQLKRRKDLIAAYDLPPDWEKLFESP